MVIHSPPHRPLLSFTWFQVLEHTKSIPTSVPLPWSFSQPVIIFINFFFFLLLFFNIIQVSAQSLPIQKVFSSTLPKIMFPSLPQVTLSFSYRLYLKLHIYLLVYWFMICVHSRMQLHEDTAFVTLFF